MSTPSKASQAETYVRLWIAASWRESNPMPVGELNDELKRIHASVQFGVEGTLHYRGCTAVRIYLHGDENVVRRKIEDLGYMVYGREAIPLESILLSRNGSS